MGGKHVYTHPAVLSPLGIVGGCRIHAEWLKRLSFLHQLMKTFSRYIFIAGGIAHFIQRKQKMIYVENGILCSLGGERTGKLGPAPDKFQCARLLVFRQIIQENSS